MLRALPTSLLLVLVACGGADFDAGSDAMASGTSSDAPSDPADSGLGPPTTPATPEAAWYALDAHLDLVAGEVRLDPPTRLRVSLVDSALAVICEHDVGITSVAPEPAPPGEPANLGWWRFELADGLPDREACPEWSARAIQLGVGPYDARLDPALAGQQTADDPTPYDTALYGLYLQEFDAGPLYVVGVVTKPGLEAADLVTAPPLADGNYAARSLILLQFGG